MDLSEFQRRALETDRTSANYEHEPQKDIVVALLGIAGELGTLAAIYKKYLRDGKAYQLHTEHLAEEIGDLLWYLAVLASKFGIDLSELATHNLMKVGDRWGESAEQRSSLYDDAYRESQQLPRSFKVQFSVREVDGRQRCVMEMDGKPLGDPLTDNTEVSDDYRFHDAFHLAFATILGWSPVLRKLMGCKRKDDQVVDENEDGGRAAVIEEGIAALVFEYGVSHGRLDGARAVDYELLRTVRTMTQRLEVKDRTAREWEEAFRAGWKVFRQLSDNSGGCVTCDLLERRIDYEPPS